MGNLCPWCKTTDDSQSNNNFSDESTRSNSQRSLTSPEANDRTPLLSKPDSQNQHHQSVIPVGLNAPISVEPSSLLTSLVPPPPPPPIITNNQTESTTGSKVPSNETAESSMANIVERMLPDLIDVGGWGNGPLPPINANSPNSTAQNEQLRELLSKSLQSTHILSLPDAGTPNLSSLLSNRPISSETCHFVAHTATELARLLIDEIKIIHKEDLVVTFE